MIDRVHRAHWSGLGFLVSEHADTDDDMDVDGDDKWYHNVYDERWRKLATYREDDSDPKEEFLPHQAGLGGFGGSSYINALVSRWKDANTAWTSASDGTLEETVYYCQNWRGDVSVLISNAGAMLEWVKYSAYGVPFALPGGDTDSDGDCDSTDITQIQTWIDAPAYDVRGDIDLDGDVDATDKSAVQGSYEGTTTGWEVLSAVGNRAGYAGYMFDGNGLWHVRHRVLDSGLGRWLRRDPLGYAGGVGLYAYASSDPAAMLDPNGLEAVGHAVRLEPFSPLGQTPSGIGLSLIKVKIHEEQLIPTKDQLASTVCSFAMLIQLNIEEQHAGFDGNFYYLWHGKEKGDTKLTGKPSWTGPGTRRRSGTPVEGTADTSEIQVNLSDELGVGESRVASWTAIGWSGGVLSAHLVYSCEPDISGAGTAPVAKGLGNKCPLWHPWWPTCLKPEGPTTGGKGGKGPTTGGPKKPPEPETGCGNDFYLGQGERCK